jgi:hypothetical protein
MADKIIKNKDGSLGGIKRNKNQKDRKKGTIKVKKPSPTTGMQRKRSPMEKERVLSTMKSDAAKLGSTVRSGEEMEAAISGLDTLTSKGPGKLKLALKGGGRAYNKNS